MGMLIIVRITDSQLQQLKHDYRRLVKKNQLEDGS